MTHRLDCEPVPSSVRTARLFVVDKLQEWRCDELVDRVALLTSELATNAVVHTGQPYSVSVERRGPAVRVEVLDKAERLPARRDLLVDLTDGADAPRDAESAFSGLGIVDATATAWGSEHVPGGKVPEFFVPGRPDLLVEVKPEWDRQEDIDAKMALYRAADVPLVWWVYAGCEEPEVAVYRRGELVARLGIGDTLDGEDVIPGFRLPLTEVFADFRRPR